MATSYNYMHNYNYNYNASRDGRRSECPGDLDEGARLIASAMSRTHGYDANSRNEGYVRYVIWAVVAGFLPGGQGVRVGRLHSRDSTQNHVARRGTLLLALTCMQN